MLGFRALQAVMDLRATAGRQPGSAIQGIAERIPPADRGRGADSRALTRVILHQGGRLEQAADVPLLDALQLAASQPDADPAAFAAATAILLADRLQNGLGRVDMAVYWENFHQTYSALPAHDRAAIVQGFLAGTAAGRIALGPPQPRQARLTDSARTVRAALRALAGSGRAPLLSAVAGAVGAQMSMLVLPHLRSLLSGSDTEPLSGDSPLFAPLLALAADPDEAAGLSATALLLSEAVATGDAEGWFSITLWPERIEGWLALQGVAGRAIIGGLRYLYEADPDWVPMPERMVTPQRMAGIPLLPVLGPGLSAADRTDSPRPG